ncbi:MAG: cation-translocating P-type ATPase, partial [Paludibacteraceae bacterium]|nr:cation-translocating P-type ATPase [Paludibacteraceae bacterium]
KVVTGDVAATAINIARSIELWNEDDDESLCSISGAEFESTPDEELRERLDRIKVVYRARPQDKKRLVQLLQQKGEVVAVTGDGTNDAPALNFAQVGVSLGSGTSVAKDASDVTLVDDSFKSLTTAIMWGRSLYKNIQRFLVYQLTINVSALLVVLLGAVIGTELPLTVTQMLWVNLIMDTFSAMALASLPPSHIVMQEPPRRNSDFIISRSMAKSIAGWGILFFIVMLLMIVYYGEMSVHELTIFFTTFVMLQFWNMFNVRTIGTRRSAFHKILGCRGMLLVAALIVCGQWLIVQFGGKVFRTVPLSLGEWAAIIVSTSLVLWTGEALRWMERMRKK